MTVIYTIEITSQYVNTDEKIETAELSVLNEKYKSAWEHKVEKAFERHLPEAKVVCTNIKVFPTRQRL